MNDMKMHGQIEVQNAYQMIRIGFKWHVSRLEKVESAMSHCLFRLLRQNLSQKWDNGIMEKV